MDLTDYAEDLLVAELTDEPWIKLHVGAPGEAGTSNAAKEDTRQKAALGGPSGGKRSTTADVEWEDVSDAEEITHVSAWDAGEGGNCEWVAELADPKGLEAGDTLKIASGDLSIELD